MGGGSSTPHRLNKSQQAIVQLMMPVYFTTDPITDHECGLAASCWDMILNEHSVYFTEVLRKSPDFKYTTCITYFFDLFYTHLFEVHPMAKPLFKRGIKSQGKFLVRLITLALSEIKDDAKWNKSFQKLAEMHNEIGVKAIEYGVMGEILFYCLRQCVGLEVYDTEMHTTWCKIMSRMLQSMIPVAVAFELKNGASEMQKLRVAANNAAMEANAREQKDKSEREGLDSTRNSTMAPNLDDVRMIQQQNVHLGSEKVAARMEEAKQATAQKAAVAAASHLQQQQQQHHQADGSTTTRAVPDQHTRAAEEVAK